MRKVQQGVRLRGRVFHSGDDVPYPGWYVQYRNQDGLQQRTLRVYAAHAAKAAVAEAAELLGCRPEEIQVEGEDWS